MLRLGAASAEEFMVLASFRRSSRWSLPSCSILMFPRLLSVPWRPLLQVPYSSRSAQLEVVIPLLQQGNLSPRAELDSSGAVDKISYECTTDSEKILINVTPDKTTTFTIETFMEALSGGDDCSMCD